ncbi:mannose-1-phosphate guanylyltransferase [Planctomycetaceae bacterium SCGC AG-212-F19]|nr:mannose-1-phosphate guanylyltransferase [Planctomycetaceae bacterium SCGC AG-212-F19]
MLHTLIMAGGGGTRFWPRSRAKKPKQFLTLAGDRSLIQQSFDRIEAQVAPERTWVITGAAYRGEVIRQLPAIPAGQVVGEPCGRDTAPCIGLGAALIHARDPEAVMVVMPADHVIEPAQEFGRAVHAAGTLAEENPSALVTIGIVPTHAATGYGYIHRGAEHQSRQGVRAFRVRQFREKPPVEQAQQYLASGEYFWNSGIFIWKTGTILRALEQLRPQLHAAIQRIAAAWDSPARDRVLEAEYLALERISIDYAVMQDAKEVLVVEAPFRWDDVGSWLALERMHPQDADGNTVLGSHCGERTKSCIIAGERGHLIATVGIDNLLIVQDGNVTLVADRRDEAAVKQLVELLKKKGLEEYL